MTIRPGHTVLNTLDYTTHTVATLHAEDFVGVGTVLLAETTNGRRLLTGACINITALARRMPVGTAVLHTTEGLGTITRAPYVTGGHIAAQVEWDSGRGGAYDTRHLAVETWWQVFVAHPGGSTEADAVLAFDAANAHASARDNWPHADIVVEPISD